MVVVAVAIGFVVGFVGTNLMEGEDEDDDEEELVSCGNGKIKEGYRGTDPVGGRFDSIRGQVVHNRQPNDVNDRINARADDYMMPLS